MTSDYDAIRRAQAEGTEGFSRLFESRKERLLARARQRVPERLRRIHSPEDVVQEAFLAAQRQFASFEPRRPGSFDAWLNIIVDRKAYELCRHEGCAKRDRDNLLTHSGIVSPDDSWCGDPIDVVRADHRTPSVNARSDELLRLVLAAWDELPEDQKQAVRLHRFEGRPLDECASIMRKSRDAVRGLCHRGLAVLRGKLPAEYQLA